MARPGMPASESPPAANWKGLGFSPPPAEIIGSRTERHCARNIARPYDMRDGRREIGMIFADGLAAAALATRSSSGDSAA